MDDWTLAIEQGNHRICALGPSLPFSIDESRGAALHRAATHLTDELGWKQNLP